MNFGDPAHPAVFKLSSVSQRLAILIELFSYLFVNLYILVVHYLDSVVTVYFHLAGPNFLSSVILGIL